MKNNKYVLSAMLVIAATTSPEITKADTSSQWLEQASKPQSEIGSMQSTEPKIWLHNDSDCTAIITKESGRNGGISINPVLVGRKGKIFVKPGEMKYINSRPFLNVGTYWLSVRNTLGGRLLPIAGDTVEIKEGAEKVIISLPYDPECTFRRVRPKKIIIE